MLEYDPKEAEPRLQAFWEKEGIYKFDPTSDRPVYSIDTPPPTVSGSLHIGHAFNFTAFDAIARFKRMKGFNLFFPFGTDDNGLATERLIEKIKGVKAVSMKRKDFVKLCLDTLVGLRKEYISEIKRIGISCDWDIFYTTIDEHCQRISQRSFIELYKKGREYQKEAPTIWCSECQTAIAQVELKDKEAQTTFNDIAFKIDEKDLIISTTRPELLPSCVAVFYNPADARYKKLKGKKAKVPLFDFSVPILEDEKVDTSKGTGIVMCCTFGDQTDIEWWREHKLPLKISITKEGKMNEAAGKYSGMLIKEARKKIIEDLKKEGLLRKQEKITHTLNVHERCGTDIEFLVTRQWFIGYLDLKEKFLELGNKLNWNPEFMHVRYDNWIKGLKWDWCISRQRYFGVPFPLWYCKTCNEIILANKNNLPVDPLIDKPPVKKCPKCNSSEFIPEQDVMDTWATSSLTPRLAIELFEKNLEYKELEKKLYPMSLRPQAQDIITFWLFNTIVKSHLHYNMLPWKNAMISGYVLDPLGEKMSKSKGNIVKPQDLIEKYSADAMRFWACSSKLGEDVATQEKEFVAGQKTITKIWNASKFVFSNIKDYKAEKQKPKNFHTFDLWLLSKLQKLIKNSTDAFENYNPSIPKSETENFFWHTFCDNYLEIIKDRFYNEARSEEEKISAKYALYESLKAILQIFAPVMPFITEEIWQNYMKHESKSIHISKWPELNKSLVNEKIERQGDKAMEIITKVRQFKSQNQKSLKTPVILTIDKKEHDELKEFMKDLKAVTNAEIREGKFSIQFA